MELNAITENCFIRFIYLENLNKMYPNKQFYIRFKSYVLEWWMFQYLKPVEPGHTPNWKLEIKIERVELSQFKLYKKCLLVIGIKSIRINIWVRAWVICCKAISWVFKVSLGSSKRGCILYEAEVWPHRVNYHEKSSSYEWMTLARIKHKGSQPFCFRSQIV